MNTTRTIAVIVVCSAMLMLWGCPSEQAEETATMDQASPGDTMPMEGMDDHQPGEHMDEDHQPGEHMDEDHAPGEHMMDTDGDESSASLSGEVVDGTRVVQVTARRYEFVPSTIVVKQGEPVRLEITATDVAHGFGVEELGIEQRLPPNETQAVEFTPEQPGEYHFHCSVYCGPGHDEMHGTLVVQE
ncbi:MAG: cupredoxin domain-containing protein [Armatimonadota bacterium]